MTDRCDRCGDRVIQLRDGLLCNCPRERKPRPKAPRVVDVMELEGEET